MSVVLPQIQPGSDGCSGGRCAGNELAPVQERRLGSNLRRRNITRFLNQHVGSGILSFVFILSNLVHSRGVFPPYSDEPEKQKFHSKYATGMRTDLNHSLIGGDGIQ